MNRPSVIFVAGPNGAGKTTAAPRILRDELEVLDYINADQIACGLSSFHPEGVAFQAGRALLERARELGALGRSFALETTLSGVAYRRWVRQLRTQGYVFHLVFLWLPTEDLAVERVSRRVQLGGHSIPEGTIRRRYRAGLHNFFNIYQTLADYWTFYDNSGGTPRLLAHGNAETVAIDAPLWHTLRQRWTS